MRLSLSAAQRIILGIPQSLPRVPRLQGFCVVVMSGVGIQAEANTLARNSVSF